MTILHMKGNNSSGAVHLLEDGGSMKMSEMPMKCEAAGFLRFQDRLYCRYILKNLPSYLFPAGRNMTGPVGVFGETVMAAVGGV